MSASAQPAGTSYCVVDEFSWILSIIIVCLSSENDKTNNIKVHIIIYTKYVKTTKYIQTMCHYTSMCKYKYNARESFLEKKIKRAKILYWYNMYNNAKKMRLHFCCLLHYCWNTFICLHGCQNYKVIRTWVNYFAHERAYNEWKWWQHTIHFITDPFINYLHAMWKIYHTLLIKCIFYAQRRIYIQLCALRSKYDASFVIKHQHRHLAKQSLLAIRYIYYNVHAYTYIVRLAPESRSSEV